jgi:hypothetical protein
MRSHLLDFLFQHDVFVSDQYNREPSSLAATWMADEALANNETSWSAMEAYKVVQRFILVTLDFALQGVNTTSPTDVPTVVNGTMGRNLEQLSVMGFTPTFAEEGVDECSWSGVTCVNGSATELKMGNRGFSGTIPSEIISLSNLTYVDFSENALHSTIPESLYGLLKLEKLYLYQNLLTGTISYELGKLWNLTTLHLSQNQLTGSIPNSITSTKNAIRPYRK